MSTSTRKHVGFGVVLFLGLTRLLSLPNVSKLFSGSDDKKTSAICTYVKEAEAYIDEFFDYHTSLGFSQIFVYDNSDGFDLKQWGYEKSLIPGNNVHVTHNSKQTSKGTSYLDCAQHAKREGHTWIAFIDVDEFLVLKHHTSVSSFLNQYCNEGALSIRILTMGTCGRYVYSPQPLTKRFQCRTNKHPEHIKTIVRLEHMDMNQIPTFDFPHLKEGYKYVTTSGKLYLDHEGFVGDEDLNVVAMYQYTYKSYKEYLLSGQYWSRNSTHPSNAPAINIKTSIEIPRGDLFDDTAWLAMQSVVPKYRYYDELFPDPTLSANSSIISSPSTISEPTAAICAIMKEEEAYIDEFVDYSTAIGFSQIYIYDNTPSFELEQWGYEKGCLSGYNVNVTHVIGQASQRPAYLHCAKRAMNDGHTWAAFIDADEFLVLKKHDNVVSFLKEYCDKGAIALHWMVMGNGGREVYSPQPVTKRFKLSLGVNEHTKAIVRLEHMDMTKKPTPHFPFLKNGYNRVTTSGKKCKDHRGPGTDDDLNIAILYHYTMKSYKEYLFKRQYRGRASTSSTHESHDRLINSAKSKNLPSGYIFDTTAWNEMKRFVPKYRYYDELFPDPQPLFTLNNTGELQEQRFYKEYFNKVWTRML